MCRSDQEDLRLARNFTAPHIVRARLYICGVERTRSHEYDTFTLLEAALVVYCENRDGSLSEGRPGVYQTQDSWKRTILRIKLQMTWGKCAHDTSHDHKNTLIGSKHFVGEDDVFSSTGKSCTVQVTLTCTRFSDSANEIKMVQSGCLIMGYEWMMR